MWGKIIIPMYRLWLNGLYGLYGPWCPLSSTRPINSISLSLSQPFKSMPVYTGFGHHYTPAQRSWRGGILVVPLHWHHNDHSGVSNHQPRGCLLNRLFRRRSKETSKLRVTGLCVGNSPGPVNSPHKGPVTRKMLPFDDVILVPVDVLYLAPFRG